MRTSWSFQWRNIYNEITQNQYEDDKGENKRVKRMFMIDNN